MIQPVSFVVNEDGCAVVVALLCKADGTPIVQADLVSIDFTLEDVDGARQTGGVSIVSVLFDELQTTTNPKLWPFPGGYNFRHVISAELLVGSHDYLLQYELVTAGGHQFKTAPVRLLINASIF
jgi:hypothetical protein